MFELEVPAEMKQLPEKVVNLDHWHQVVVTGKSIHVAGVGGSDSELDPEEREAQRLDEADGRGDEAEDTLSRAGFGAPEHGVPGDELGGTGDDTVWGA